MSTLMDFDDTNIDDGQEYPEYIETVADDNAPQVDAVEEVEDDYQHVDHIVEEKPKAKTKSKVVEEDQFELLSLKHQADLEAMQERLLESQAQVQHLNQQFQSYQAQQGTGNAASLLAAKEHELAQVKNEYIAARNAFNPEAEMAALDKRDRVMQEIAQLKSAPQQNNVVQQQQQQPIQSNPSQNKALDKLNQFVTKPEHAWMKNSFDTRTLTPLDADGMIANKIFQTLTEQGKHPGTPSFWDLYGLELKKQIPAKYGSHYGKRSPSVSGNSGNSSSAPAAKPEVKLDGFQKNFTEILSKGDPKKKERIARQLTGNVPSGNGNAMFEFGITK